MYQSPIHTDDYDLTIAGVFTVRDAVKIRYPFVEAILSALPFVDQLYVNDGGSNDGTYLMLERLADEYDTITVTQYADNELSAPDNEYWDVIDIGIEQLMDDARNDIDPDWFLHLQADELWGLEYNHDAVFDAILDAHNNGYNGIRQERAGLAASSSHGVTAKTDYCYEVIRLYRNDDNIRSAQGGDCFHFEDQQMVHPEHSSHYLPPEYTLDIPFHHFAPPSQWRVLRHTNHLAEGHGGRQRFLKRVLDNTRYTKEEIEQILHNREATSIDELIVEDENRQFTAPSDCANDQLIPAAPARRYFPGDKEDTGYIRSWLLDRNQLSERTGIDYTIIP